MKAVVLTEIEQIEIVEIDEPAAGAEDVTIEVRAGGICGSDMHAYRGKHPFRKPPVVMGHEVAGRVVAVGAAVTRSRSGRQRGCRAARSRAAFAGCAFAAAQISAAMLGDRARWEGTFAEKMVAPEKRVVPPNFEHQL